MNCAYFAAARCRSCSELATPYPAQIAAKQQRAMAALAGCADWLPTFVGKPMGFRNKAKMAIGGSLEAPTLGLIDANGIGIELMHCPLYPASMQAAFLPIRELLIAARVPPYDLATRRGEGKYVLLTEAPGSGEMLLRFVLRSREAVERIAKQLPALQVALPALRVVSVNLLPEHKAVTEGATEILLSTSSAIRCELNGIALQLTPRSFLQTHSEGAAAMYRQARDWLELSPVRSIWDLYCGVGGFALHAAAPTRSVTGVEATPEAIAAARQSSSAIDWICADATEWALTQSSAADCVIVNPPRRGIGTRLASWLNQSQAATIIYSSCNIESLARDLDALGNYRIATARVFDLFPHTLHFETMVLLDRRKPGH